MSIINRAVAAMAQSRLTLFVVPARRRMFRLDYTASSITRPNCLRQDRFSLAGQCRIPLGHPNSPLRAHDADATPTSKSRVSISKPTLQLVVGEIIERKRPENDDGGETDRLRES